VPVSFVLAASCLLLVLIFINKPPARTSLCYYYVVSEHRLLLCLQLCTYSRPLGDPLSLITILAYQSLPTLTATRSVEFRVLLYRPYYLLTRYRKHKRYLFSFSLFLYLLHTLRHSLTLWYVSECNCIRWLSTFPVKRNYVLLVLLTTTVYYASTIIVACDCTYPHSTHTVCISVQLHIYGYCMTDTILLFIHNNILLS
jgi:hypothetical protein